MKPPVFVLHIWRAQCTVRRRCGDHAYLDGLTGLHGAMLFYLVRRWLDAGAGVIATLALSGPGHDALCFWFFDPGRAPGSPLRSLVCWP